MSTSLSKLVKYLLGKLHSNKCTDCKAKLAYMPFKGDQLIFTCFECKKNYQKDFDKDMINRFADAYRLCNKDINKFILLLTEGVYSYEYMDS